MEASPGWARSMDRVARAALAVMASSRRRESDAGGGEAQAQASRHLAHLGHLVHGEVVAGHYVDLAAAGGELDPGQLGVRRLAFGTLPGAEEECRAAVGAW